MVRRRAAVLALAVAAPLLVGSGCGPSAFSCENDEACRGDGQGFCEADGACSFLDPTCPSGRRYGDLGPADIAGECVPAPDDTSTGSGAADAETGGDPSEPTTATTTSDTTDDDTTGVITTDPADSVSTTHTTTTTTTTTTTETDGNGENSYGPCDDEESDCIAEEQCGPIGALPLTCSAPCESVVDCPPPNGGTAIPACVMGDDGTSWCLLRCDDRVECPDGMDCTDWRQMPDGRVCTWF